MKAEEVVLVYTTFCIMPVNKRNKLAKILLVAEIALYISIACGMAYAIVN